MAGAIHIAATSSAAFKGGGISARAGDVAGGDADPYAGNVEFSSGKGDARSGGVVLENRAGGTKAGFSIIGADWGSVAGGTALLHAGEGDSAGGLACLSGGGTTNRAAAGGNVMIHGGAMSRQAQTCVGGGLLLKSGLTFKTALPSLSPASSVTQTLKNEASKGMRLF